MVVALQEQQQQEEGEFVVVVAQVQVQELGEKLQLERILLRCRTMTVLGLSSCLSRVVRRTELLVAAVRLLEQLVVVFFRGVAAQRHLAL